jgi:hypothetical protein
MTAEEKAEIKRRTGHATLVLLVLFLYTGWRAFVVYANNGMMAPEDEGCDKLLGMLAGAWGVILLFIFRYSYELVFMELGLALTGAYLFFAPVMGQ